MVRSLLCFWAVGELSMSLTDVPKKLGISVPTVSVVVQRGEKIARQEELELPVLLYKNMKGVPFCMPFRKSHFPWR